MREGGQVQKIVPTTTQGAATKASNSQVQSGVFSLAQFIMTDVSPAEVRHSLLRHAKGAEPLSEGALTNGGAEQPDKKPQPIEIKLGGFLSELGECAETERKRVLLREIFKYLAVETKSADLTSDDVKLLSDCVFDTSLSVETRKRVLVALRIDYPAIRRGHVELITDLRKIVQSERIKWELRVEALYSLVNAHAQNYAHEKECKETSDAIHSAFHRLSKEKKLGAMIDSFARIRNNRNHNLNMAYSMHVVSVLLDELVVQMMRSYAHGKPRTKAARKSYGCIRTVALKSKFIADRLLKEHSGEYSKNRKTWECIREQAKRLEEMKRTEQAQGKDSTSETVFGIVGPDMTFPAGVAFPVRVILPAQGHS
jgi:hypothetical protein